MENVALIVAAGSGVRFGGETPKQFRPVNGRPLLSWTISAFEKTDCITDVVLVVARDFLLYANNSVVEPYGFSKVRKIVAGGDTRTESVALGLKALPISTKYVAIHDGARPITAPDDINSVFQSAINNRAAILARPATDTVKRVEADYIISTLDREKIYLAETPQVFQYDLIMSAIEKFGDQEDVTDDASIVEQLGFKVMTVVPKYLNIKVTNETDLNIIRSLIDERE